MHDHLHNNKVKAMGPHPLIKAYLEKDFRIYKWTSRYIGDILSPLFLHIVHIRLICLTKADFGRKQFWGTSLYPQFGNELWYMHVKCTYLRTLPFSVDYYASALLTRPRSEFSAYLSPPWPWPFDPEFWGIYPCPKVHQCWKFGEIVSSNAHDILLTMFLRDIGTGTRTHEKLENIMPTATLRGVGIKYTLQPC